jgi:hypothetical protein
MTLDEALARIAELEAEVAQLDAEAQSGFEYQQRRDDAVTNDLYMIQVAVQGALNVINAMHDPDDPSRYDFPEDANEEPTT